jgi:capsular exopolysaccharide synthesis family protein
MDWKVILMSEINFGSSTNNSYRPTDSVVNDDASLDVMYYYRLMLRNLWKVILFSLCVGAFAALYALSLPPIYTSSTSLLIEGQQPNVLSFQDVYKVDTRNREYLGTQLQILKSRALASRVVDRMQLTRHPLFDVRQKTKKANKFSLQTILSLLGLSQPDQENEVEVEPVVVEEAVQLAGDAESAEAFEAYLRKHTIGIVMRSLVVFPVRGTKLVNIGFSAQDPQLAADIANAFAETYIESHLEAKLEVTQKASSWLSDRLGDLRQNLRVSEQALQNFREREQLVDTGDLRSIDVVELEQLTESLVQATQAKNEARSLYRQVSTRGLSTERILSLPTMSNNLGVQNLVEAKAQASRLVAELGERYKSKHPKMLAAMSDLTQLDNELKAQIGIVAKGLEVNYNAARDSERQIKQQIEVVKDRLQNVSRKEFALRELEREVDANRQVYEVFLNRGKETNETVNLQTVNARVIDVAQPADYPVKPQKTKIVFMALMASAAFAAGVILLLDWLDNTIKTPEDVEEKLRVPLLGHLPLDKTNKDDTPFLGFLSEDSWHFAEAIRTIRTSFILSGLDKPAKVTVVTSSVPNEGKSTVSICIAHALGQMEKVLLIDADMRKPSVGKALDISLLTPGLSNLIAGTADLEECITTLPKSEVHVLTAGVVLGNPLDLIAGDRFAEVLNMLKEKYDRILIDSAPIQAVSDSLVIATHADALIYVVKSDSSSTPLIKKGLRRLSETNARFSGVVLNQVDVDKMKKQSGYDSGYYDNYGYAYGDGNDSGSKA